MSAAKTRAKKRSVKANGNHAVTHDHSDRGSSESLVDRITAAWGAIVVERIAADQTLAEHYERYAQAPRDIRRVFAWDALVASEAHLTMVNEIIGRHLDAEGRGDAVAILADLADERRRVAAQLAVGAFSAVLSQMSPKKPKWRGGLEDEDAFDERIAVLALAHQTLSRAVESLRMAPPADVTELVLEAAQDPLVWEMRNHPAGGLRPAACQAAAVFFSRVGAGELGKVEDVAQLYAVPVRAAAPA